VQDEGVALAVQNTLNFVGAGVVAADDSANGRTTITISGGSAGHVIQEEGTPLIARAALNFTGPGVIATDDVANSRTNVTITGVPQTPWLQNINAAGFTLGRVAAIGVGPSADAIASIGIFIDGTGFFDGLKQINSSPTGWAGCQLQNDAGSTITMRVYGTGRSPSNLARIETSGPLSFTVQSVEVVRLSLDGKVGIRKAPTTYSLEVSGDCDITGVYRVNGVPFTSGQPQTPWAQHVSAANFNLTNLASLMMDHPTNQVYMDIRTNGVTGFTFARYTGIAGVNGDTEMIHWGTGVLTLETADAASKLKLRSNTVQVIGTAATTDLVIDTTTAGTPYLNFKSAGFVKGQIMATNGGSMNHITDVGVIAITIVSDGRVGIGKTPASFKLDVNGSVNVPTGSTYNINGVPLTSGQPQTPWAQNIDAATFTLSNVGAIGVGTGAGPAASYNSVSATVSDGFRHTCTAAAAFSGVRLLNDIGTTLQVRMYGSTQGLFPDIAVINSDKILVLATANTDRLRITADGNVGIGNTGVPPHSAAGFQHLIFGPASPVSTVSPMLTIAGDGATLAFANYKITATEKRITQIVCSASGVNGDSGSFVFYTWNAGAAVGGMTIDPSGKVQVGPGATATYPLNVAGDCNVTGVYRINGVPLSTGGGSQTPWLTDIDGGGKSLTNCSSITLVGGVALTLFGPTSVGVAQIELQNQGAARWAFGRGPGDGSDNFNFYSYVTSGIIMRISPTAAANRLNITGNNVGIGTATPPLPLSVMGGYADPVLGTGYKGTLAVLPSDTTWGMLFGARADGTGWIQMQRTDATAASYPLALNPLGGSPVGIGCIAPNLYTGAGLVVVSGTAGKQIQVIEPGGNAQYRLEVGYAVLAGNWAGRIQALVTETPYQLHLNPLGGGVSIGPSTTIPAVGLQLVGTGQATTTPTFPGGAHGCTLLIADTNPPGAAGGMLAFGGRGSDGSAFAAIKGYYSNGGGNTAGWLMFLTRRSVDSATLTPAMTIVENGSVGIDCLPGCTLSTGSTLATCKIATYELSNGFFGIGVQNGVLTFALASLGSMPRPR
jgi:hypothetical protein